MVRSRLIHLGTLPLEINDKVIRKVVLKSNFINSISYVAPRNKLENQVCSIWAEILSLPKDKIGIHDNFLRLGGDSILAIKLVSKLNKTLNSSISVSVFLKHNTVSKLSHYLKNNTEDNVIIDKAKITKVEEQILSFAQERLRFIEKYEEGTNAYNISLVFKLSRDTKLDVLEKSIRSMVSRHEILRTLIKDDQEGHGYQLVLDDKEYPLEITKITITNKEQLDLELTKSVNHIYDLSQEYPIRVCLYELSNPNAEDDIEYYLSIVIHHIAFDGWSNNIFLTELQAYYNYYLEQVQGLDTKLNLSELSIQYKDFALWQRSYLQGENLDRQLNYWKDKLSDYETLNLITDKLRPTQVDYIGHDIYFDIDEDTSLALRELAKELNVSLYSLLLSGYYLMLRSYSNQDDIVVGTPIANRHYSQIENLIGFFVNTLALRIKIDSQVSLGEFIKQVGDEVVEAQFHQDLPFEKLVEELKVPKDTSRHPIFQVMFEVQNFGETVIDNQAGEQIETNLLQPYTAATSLYNIAKFDITTTIDDSKVCLRGNFNYAVSLYTEETINRFIETYTQILKQLANLANNSAKQEQIKIGELSYLNEEQYKEIIYTWNQTEKEYPSDKTIHALFEEQVERTPDRVAAQYNDHSITYSELNRKANKLARYLKNHGIEKEDTVVVVMDRSIDLILSIIAISKSGGVYIPTDPHAPSERNIYICKNAKAKVAIANSRLPWLEDSVVSEIIILSEIETEVNKQGSNDLNVYINSMALSYIIFTSGSTGLPKGVMLSHQGMINHIYCKVKDLYIDDTDIIAQTATQIFDISIWQLLTSLVTGGKVVVFSEEIIKDVGQFINNIHREHITVLQLVPAYTHSLALYMKSNNSNNFQYLKYLIITGEALPNQVCQEVLAVNNKTLIVNAYGPTECSDDVTHYHYKFDQANINNFPIIPIGSVLQNLQIYILTSQLLPVPIGVVGELYIGGVGIARGYYNRPDLTAERFIANPFATDEDLLLKRNLRIYRTGDLVRYLSDKNIEYIGRSDTQVKIRGYRIELGEIESIISEYEGIRQGIVLVKEHIDTTGISTGNKYLVGYYLSDNELDKDRLVSYLRNKLPEYMVPSIMVHLEKLPLTINGKLDRKSLPEPEFIGSNNYIEPRNELEGQVRNIWAGVLGVAEDKVGIRDDFFRLGGDSIVSIQLVSRLRQRLGLSISVKDIFSYKSIERLYDNVISKRLISNTEQVKTEQGILSGALPLLPIQEWFFESNFSRPNHWNQSFLVRTPILDLDKLQASIVKLVKHHDSFRLRYERAKDLISNVPATDETEVTNIVSVDSGYIQYYDSKAKVRELKILDIRTLEGREGSKKFEEELQEILTEWQIEFDLEQGLTYSIGYIYGYKDGSSRIYFALHHLIVDVISWRILVEDLRDLYNEKELGAKGSSYRQWVNTIKRYVNTHKDEQSYWISILSDYDTYTNKINSLVVSEMTKSYSTLKLNTKQTKQLLQESNRAYNTQVNDILLTALGSSLFKLTRERVNHIVLEGHGREEIDRSIDVTRTTGWFTTMYPVRLEVSEELSSSIKNTKESLRLVPNKGIGYGALIGYKENILPRISFNYLGQFDQEGVSQNSEGIWTIVSEGSGISVDQANLDYYVININGLVVDGELKFNIVSKLDAETTIKITELFKQALENIINHTVTQNRSYLTISDVDNIIISQEYLDRLQQAKEIEGVYLANSLQQGFIYHALNQEDMDDAYLVQSSWQYNNPIDINKLKEAWSCAQKRFGSLRLRFAWEEELIQIIDREGVLDWRYIDLSKEQDVITQELKIKNIQEEDRHEPYKLDQGNLFRIYLIKQREDLYTCIFSNHHAILDGWSNPVLRGYVHEVYLKLKDNEIVSIKEDLSYENAQKYLQAHKEDNKDFWDKYVLQIEERSDLNALLSTINKNKHIRISEYKHILAPTEQTLIIKDNLYYSLKKLSQEEGITLNAILQYVWHKVISIYSNSKQTIVGITVSGRDISINDIESSVGLYINTLPLIVNHQVQRAESIIEIIRNIQDNINEINSRSNVSLAKIQSGGERLFDSLFIYENYPNPVNEEQQHRLKIRFQGSVEKLDYPLGITAYEADSQLILKLNYAGELFSKDSIECLLTMTNTLLEQIVANPKQQVQNLNYLNQAQYKQIIQDWNKTDQDFPNNKTIDELFEEQVEQTPDAIAIIYGENNLTYRELNIKANQLANYLRQIYDIKPDTLIGLCLDRNEYMLISIIAVLKAGGAYVPMDTSYPDERIKYILEDTNAKVVLTNWLYKERLDNLTSVHKPNILAVDDIETTKKLKEQTNRNPNTGTRSTDLAYVIYTSGTTGNPKGVMIEHKAYLALIACMKNLYFTDKCQIRTYSITSYVFDIFGLEFGLPFLTGGIITIGSSEFVSLDCTHFDFIQITPSLCDLKLDCLANTFCIKLLVGGENINYDLLGKILNKSITTINVYGPTETTIWSMSKEYLFQENKSLLHVSLGKPLNNEKIYVLDTNLTPLPIGAVGELYIGGVGIARGYYNRPDLTAERFIVNKFQDEDKTKQYKSERLYKTGDLVRWLPDGNLEYIGRNDFQVKIRGYRIELGEIESIISEYEGIRQGIVLVKEHIDTTGIPTGNKYLVGYYLSDNELDKDRLVNYLRNKLPEYMVPSIMVHLEKLPLTINGKLDRKALPDPEFISSDNYASPRNELERRICKTWSEVLLLTVDKIGIHDSFFRLGGNSVLAIKLIGKLTKELGSSFNVSTIFRHNTVKKLALYITQNIEKGSNQPDAILDEGEL